MTGTYQPPSGDIFREARAARMLSAEQQHPMTAAEWAGAVFCSIVMQVLDNQEVNDD